MTGQKRNWAFVVPRFGEGIIGGAETLAGKLASRLAQRGDGVRILTTCAVDNRSWENQYPEGKAIEYGLEVERFSVDHRDLEKWIPHQIAISEGLELSIEQELEWMENSVNSLSLYQHIQRNADSFDLIFFAPYLFGSSFWGSLIRPDKSCLIPCLHDESQAYTKTIGSMFRQVNKALFNAAPEMDLARTLYGDIQGGVVGMGFDPLDSSYVKNLTPYFEDDFPYLLYVGRKETGKNVDWLIDQFIAAKESSKEALVDHRLVILGGGSFSDLHRDEVLNRGDVLDISAVSEEDKLRLMKHALSVVQPSRNESFSIVLFEAWQVGTPVLVHALCPVTRDHVVKSNGGLYFGNAAELAGILEEFQNQPDLYSRLAESAEEYLLHEFSWEAVLKRFDRVTDRLLGVAQGARKSC